MTRPLVTGHFQTAAISGFSVFERGDRLFLRQPPIPDEYSPEVEWVGPARMRVLSGPGAGAEVDVEVEDGIVVGGTIYGALPFHRTDTPPEPTPGEGLLAPPFAPDANRDSIFEEFWSAHRPGGELTVPAPYRPFEFIMWLMGKDEFIFHGSAKTDIEVFEPRRDSVEIMDFGGHGNLGAVYGTHDGLWAMFFAVIDRSRIEGSIRNGVATYRSWKTGEEVDFYQFSVSARNVPDRPFSPGGLYVLPRETFERIRLGPGGPFTNEWGSPSPVRPLAMLQVIPEDFPFLDDVAGHDDEDLIRYNEVSSEVYRSVESARRIEGGFRLTLSKGLDPQVLAEWFEAGRRFFPDVMREDVDDVTVEILAPEAVLHTLEARLEERLEA
ncbi:MAG: hypothetical protein R3258_00060 [Acidimicrobiia bacterium]|nr:hypothetical protein [Acidimicrobiia bacterium]